MNYTSVMGKDYWDSEDVNFTDFSNMLKYMNSEFITQIKWLSALEVWNYSELEKYFSDKQLEDNVYFWDNQYSFWDYIVMVKLLMPSLWTCNYFYRNVWEWTHHWVDIILPKWYPLPAFLDWEIVRVMNRDWKRKNEWNCIVIKSEYKWETIYLCYEHMDSINVENWQKVKQWDIVWYCGTTWNSTQYHLHFQVDNDLAPFHPYYCSSKSIPEISKYTLDPIEILKSYSWVDWYYFIDLHED